MPLLSRCRDGTHGEEDMSWISVLTGFFCSIGQVDLDLLRSQQLKLYILKAGRALLSHQDKLRQILSQPAVQEPGTLHAGIFLTGSFT